jgi:membrane-associated phospholipid phosphatase
MKDADRPQAEPTVAEPVWTLSPRLTTALVGAAILSIWLALGLVVVNAMQTGTGLATFDGPLHDWAVTIRTPSLDAAVTVFTNLGQTIPMLIIGTTLSTALFVRYRQIWIWVLMVIAPIVSTNLSSLLKEQFARPRPPFADAVAPYETSFSFPSGHTLNATVIAGTLAYLTLWLAKRGWVRVLALVAAITWSVAMGASRIYLGHHWLTDVVFGWLVGLSWLTILLTAHQLWLRSRPSEVSPPPQTPSH